MHALICHETGNPDGLKYEEILEPPVGPEQVLVKMLACGLNFPDLLILKGIYQFKPDLPFSPGGEVAGVVESVGSQVTRFKPGDPVFSLCKWGGLAEKVILAENQTHLIPEGLSFLDAASLFYNFGTAYHALFDRGQLKMGETLLVLGASGGVGLAAVQLAKVKGAKVIAATSAKNKLELCKEYGADELINYTEEPLKSRIKALTKGEGVDVVFDPVGGEYTGQAIRGMAFAGRYLILGFANGEIPRMPLNIPLLKSCAVVGVFYGRFSKEYPEKAQANFDVITDWRLQGKIKPHISDVYPLDQSKSALSDLDNRKVLGKAIVATTNPKELGEIPRPSFGKRLLEIESPKELKAWVGKRLGTSPWFHMDQERVNSFAQCTLDEQWIHLDKNRAKATKFESPIAHGFLTLSLIPHLMNQICEIRFAKMGINYGIEKVRFIQAVKVGSEIRLHAKLKYFSDFHHAGHKLVFEAELEIKGEERPACYAELIMVFYAHNIS